MLSAAQLADRLQVPVPLVIFTRLPAIEQAPVAVMTAGVLALVDDATVNVDQYAAVAGAPVNVTDGVARTTGGTAAPLIVTSSISGV